MANLVERQAPDFTATAARGGELIEGFKLSDFKGKYVVLFFYPLDFTFVCPTELHAFNERLADFKERGAEVVAVSVDSPYSHLAWLRTPRAKGGIEGVEYPIVSDLAKRISRSYGVLKEDMGVAYRGLFIIDPDGVVQHQLVNNLPIGRSVEEALRVLDAIQFHAEHGDVCPANWKKGEKALKPTTEGVAKYLAGKK